MDTTQIRYFISAVDVGNFTVAAADNNISQSSFSKKIMALERELGVELFTRSKRNLVLTDAGQFFFKYAKDFELNYYSMRASLQQFSSAHTGLVRVSSIPVIHPYSLASFFSGFKSAYPGIALSIIELSESTFVYDSLRRGECDCAITRIDFLDIDQYDVIPLVQDELIILVPLGHRLAQYDTVSAAQLQNEKIAFPMKGTDFYNLCEAACLKGGFTPNPYFTIGGRTALIDMMQNDQFIAFSMEKIAIRTPSEHLKIVHLHEKIISTTALIRRRKHAMHDNMKHFWSYAQKYWAETP